MIDDGGPAFPARRRRDPAEPPPLSGMSLRDYFAAQAIVGAVALNIYADQIAHEAFRIADAMIAERNASR